MAAFKPEDAPDIKADAENHLWDYLRGQLEQQGKGESAGYLRHFLMAQAGEPKLRGELARVPFDMYHRVSDYTVKMDAMDGSVMGWHFELLAGDPGKSVPEDKALANAQAEANLPPGAVPKVSEYEAMGDTPVFVARWEHEENGIPVERDFIHVLVNGKSGHPFALYRKWHALDFKPKER
jgi:hypothetical protein